jgi:hypothetical protein
MPQARALLPHLPDALDDPSIFLAQLLRFRPQTLAFPLDGRYALFRTHLL